MAGAPLKNLGVEPVSCSPVEVSIELPIEVPIDVVLGWVSVKCAPVVEVSIELPIDVPKEAVLGWGSRLAVAEEKNSLVQEKAGSCTCLGDIGPSASSPGEWGRIVDITLSSL